jgi:hypothetical protein
MKPCCKEAFEDKPKSLFRRAFNWIVLGILLVLAAGILIQMIA